LSGYAFCIFIAGEEAVDKNFEWKKCGIERMLVSI
jgi:hypothetical protein